MTWLYAPSYEGKINKDDTWTDPRIVDWVQKCENWDAAGIRLPRSEFSKRILLRRCVLRTLRRLRLAKINRYWRQRCTQSP